MSLLRDLRRRIPLVGKQALLAAVVGYFAYHAVQGQRGLKSWNDMRQQVVEAEMTLDALVAERVRIENKVTRLRRPSLDTDLLEVRTHTSG